MIYKRVIPRDLFNESKLLKCLGKITLLIHEKMIPGLNVNLEGEASGFIIQQGISGEIYCVNLQFFDDNGTAVYFETGLNSKENYPLVMNYGNDIYYPLNEAGEYQLDKNLFKKEK